MADLIGQQLGNYRLIRLLGRGGFGEVYLGQHLRLNMQAAIKVQRLQLSDDEIETFHQEAQTIVSLVHPHIVRVLDFDVKEGLPFLVMDYAPNGSLRHLHPRGTQLALSLVVSYVKQVADALQYAHDQRLMHRDVKPDNMLLGRGGEVLLTDFGLATIAHRTSSQSTQVMAGTVPYMAPEQMQGKPRPASDQYALGIVVYEWLTGARPFEGTATEIAMQHVLSPPAPFTHKVPALSREVEQVVLTALAKDPKQRFRTIQAFATALEQASQPKPSGPVTISSAHVSVDESQFQLSPPATMSHGPANSSLQQAVSDVAEDTSAHVHDLAPEPSEGSALPVSVSPPSPFPRQEAVPLGQSQSEPAQRRISRRTLVLGLGLTGGVVASSGLAWLAFSQREHIPVGRTLYTYHGHADRVNALAWSPDGRRIASGSDDGTVQVWDATTGGYVFTYRGHANSVEAVAWSPDGKRIASGEGFSGSANTTVQVWNATTGEQVFTWGHDFAVTSVVWSPDGKHIASGGEDLTVQVWDATTGGHVFTYRGHSFAVRAVAWSADGTRLASGGVDDTVQVWDATTGGHVFTYRRHANSVEAVAWSPDGTHIASGSLDDTVQVWNAATDEQIFTYQGHANSVEAVVWSPDGTRIASGSWDKTVQVWQAA